MAGTTSGKEQLGFYVSPAMREAMDAYTNSHDISLSELIRRSVAKYIGYKLEQEEVQLGRPRKYATPEEAKAAAEAARKQKAATLKALWEQFQKGEKDKAIKALESSLDAKADGKTPKPPKSTTGGK